MKIDGYIACICEGSAEQAIIELLLEHDRLKFTEDQMLEGEPIRIRSAKQFQEKYLRKGFDKKITILRILDSRKENFKLSKAYEDKVDIINIITAPEIEMLIIYNENKYSEYKKEYNKSKMKPSDFCKMKLNLKKVKDYNFLKKYFSNIECLIKSITAYKSNSKIKKGEKTIYDLIKK